MWTDAPAPLAGAVVSGRHAAATPFASVVVPARDAAAILPALLASLAGQDLDRGELEVVVVDNASRDATALVAESAGARVVTEQIPGRARARNTGAAAARGRRLLFVDADCVAEPGWARALVACLEGASLVAGPVRLRSGDPPNAVERLERLWRFDQEGHVRRDGWAASANLAMRCEAFEAVGGFDAGFERIGEDVDLCLRAAGVGHALAFCPEAVVSHAVESSIATVARRGVAHGWSNLQLFRRHPGRAGSAYWRHPGPVVRGDWALRRFVEDPSTIALGERRRMLALARIEYGARVVGSAWAALRGAR